VALGAITPASGEDWYSFSAQGGNNLVVNVTLPGGAPGSGQQFTNSLSPVVELYAADGTLLASGTTSLSYTVPAGGDGVFEVRILSASGSVGECILQVQGATTSAPPGPLEVLVPAAPTGILSAFLKTLPGNGWLPGDGGGSSSASQPRLPGGSGGSAGGASSPSNRGGAGRLSRRIGVPPWDEVQTQVGRRKLPPLGEDGTGGPLG
jgi:hypothetical protein